MLGQFSDWLQISLNLFNQSTARIVWNLFLAFVPLIFSFYLFRISSQYAIYLWWILLVIFIAFLPNAPYVLTDSIHIIELSPARLSSMGDRNLIVNSSIHGVYPSLGFEAYVVSLSRARSILGYLSTHPILPYRLMLKAIAHGLSVVGVYIGRFERFNSWDFVTKPGTVLFTTVQDLLEIEKLLSMAIAFIVIWLLSELVERVNRQIARTAKNSPQA